MPVRFPDMRRNGWDALPGLAERLPAGEFYADLGNAINVAADNFDPPESALGGSLMNEAEVEAPRDVWTAWEAVVADVSTRIDSDDEQYRRSTCWPAVVAAARRARALLASNGV